MVHLVARTTTRTTSNDDVERALAAAQARSALHDHTAIGNRVTARILARRTLPDALGQAIATSVAAIFANEATLALKAPAGIPDRARREALLRGFDDEDQRLETFSRAVETMIGALVDAIDIPDARGWTTLSLDVPSATRMRAVAERLTCTLQAALKFAPDTERDDPVFAAGFALAGDLMKKLLRVSGLTEQEARARPHKVKWPSGDDGSAMVAQYFAGTALEPILTAPITLDITDTHLLEHMTIIAGSGAGKSQTIEAIIARHLERPDPVGLVVIDSQGDLMAHIMRHQACRERLIYIDPSDVDHPPALNLFDMGQRRSVGGDARLREAIRNGILELYEYVLGDLLLQDMTAKQLVPFRFLCALMLEIPGATLQDLRAILDDIAPYRDAVAKLSPTGQRFFERDYASKAFAESRQQIGWRLDSLFVRASFERMFAARESRLDLFAALDAGKIVLVNTAKEFLREEASSIFGRYMIAATLAAVLDRARQPEHQRRMAFLVVDEAQEYLSGSLDTLLRQARKYNLGVLLASQTIANMPPVLRDSLMANTAIKLAAAISDRGAETLAANMKTTSDFIHAQTKTAESARFAIYVRNLTREAGSLVVPFGALARAPQLSERELVALLERNRRALSAPTEAPRPDAAGRDTPRPAMPGRGRPRKGGDDDGWETY